MLHVESIGLNLAGASKLIQDIFNYSLLTFTCPMSTIKTLEKGVKYVQS